ncbi:DUF3618 domain-containing protein [Marisediminicola senii]|uniref:DUF3618 domain-containing protein n=1 Tax=Marisediminicola senii TaxID=2711233 RepID=UPI0013EA87AE|nr:DUF3618 domain-containing protein [Marisediminicola senii]
MSDSNTSDIQHKVAQTRAQLESTLDEIEDRLNVPKQVGIAAGRARASYEADPVPWIAGVGAAIAVVGGIVAWAIVSRD